MPWRPPPGRCCRQLSLPHLRASVRRALTLLKPVGSRYARYDSSCNLRGQRIGLPLVVGPVDLEIVALVAALETEFDIRVLGHRRAPIRQEHGLAVAFERQLLDEVRR